MHTRSKTVGLVVSAATAAAFALAATPAEAATATLTLGPGAYTVDTTALTITGPSTTLSGAAVGGIAVFSFTGLTIQSGAVLTVSGKRPLELRATKSMTVSGTITADGGDATTQTVTPGAAGPGGGAGGKGAGTAFTVGGGQGGGGIANAAGSGGGGGGFGGKGAAGGAQNGEEAGSRGQTYGNLNVALEAGSGGGGASNVGGGGGGGAVALVAGSLTITGSGTVTADGGNGAGGSFGASGGGSGGGIVLHANTLKVNGALSARGGLGGGGGCCGDGGGGGGGRIALQFRTYDSATADFSVAGADSGVVDFGSGSPSPQPTGATGLITYRAISSTTLSIGRSTTVTRGQRVTVKTKLTDRGSGKALAKQHVVLYQRASKTAPWSKVASRTTSAKGTASVKITAKKSKQYQWRYAGDWTHSASTSATQSVKVRR